MDHATDPQMHFHHCHGQRPQRLGSSQPSDPMSSPSSSSHPQRASSPSTSTAASSSYFVRSEQPHEPQPDEVPTSAAPASVQHSHTRESTSEYEDIQLGSKQQHDLGATSAPLTRATSSSSILDSGEIAVAIKCPALDKDSAVIKASLTDTVLALKRKIELTWAGAPRAAGMRCIRSGRILADSEVLAQLADNLEPDEPLSLHLAIRPDAWSDPQNRPTPSRRSSYLRQQQQQLQQTLQSLPRSALATQAPLTHHDQPASSPPATAPAHPQFEPYFSEPRHPLSSSSRAPEQRAHSILRRDASTSPSGHAAMRASQASAEAHAILEQTLRVTAPANWPLLVEALAAACDEYILMYETIYNQALAAQKHSAGSAEQPPATFWSSPSELLTSVESTLLAWNPVALPGRSARSSDEAQFLYQQVSHRGLPYLLRIAAHPVDVERSEAMHTLLERIHILGSMIDKIDNIVALGSLFRSASPPSAARAAPGTAAHSIDSSAARTAALEQGGLVAATTRAVQSWIAELRTVTFADVSAVLVPMFFVGFKVGILLSVMLPGADVVKKYFVIGMAAVYIVFESFRIVQRRQRARQRLQPRQPARPVRGADDGRGEAEPDVEAANPRAGGGEGHDVPAGANVPSAPSHEQQAERQAEEDPLRPLPPPQAPVRFRSRSRFTYDWCVDHMALIGLDAEDAELGLLPASGPVGRGGSGGGRGMGEGENWLGRVLGSSWVLPVVLFVVTMLPEVEQRRKRAIEERERVIRKWARLEHERRQRATELLAQQTEAEKATTQARAHDAAGAHDSTLQLKRSEYADRIARQRRSTEAIDLQEDLNPLLPPPPIDEDEDDFEDMNLF